jgi:hypothetical protein
MMTKEDDETTLRSWSLLNLWLTKQTDEKEVKRMLDLELAPGRKVRPTIALRMYMRYANLRRQREMTELYGR